MTWTRSRTIIGVIFLMGGCQKPQPEYQIKTDAISIAYIKSLYKGYPLQLDGNISIEGVLKSNDREGDFYKTLVVEDQTGGIDIKIDLVDYFIFYPYSHKYTIHCNGLTLGNYSGIHQLGYTSLDPDYQVSTIPTDRINMHISKASIEEYPLIPTMLTFDELSHRFISCWVGFDPVQFIDEELGLAWTENNTSTHRHLVNQHGDTLRIRTGMGIDYAEQLIPTGSGSINGILGIFNKEYSLRISTLYHVVLEDPRFIPQVNLKTTNSLAEEHPTRDLSVL